MLHNGFGDVELTVQIKNCSCSLGMRAKPVCRIIDDTANGDLTIFGEFFTMIPCAPRH